MLFRCVRTREAVKYAIRVQMGVQGNVFTLIIRLNGFNRDAKLVFNKFLKRDVGYENLVFAVKKICPCVAGIIINNEEHIPSP